MGILDVPGYSRTQTDAAIAAAQVAVNVDNLMTSRFAALPAEDAVTISIITDAEYVATPSLGVAGGTLIKPARIGGGTLGDVDMSFDTKFRYSGGTTGKGIDADWVSPGNTISGVNMLLHPEFVTSRGVSKIMLKVKPSATGITGLPYRVTVGELWESEELRRPTTVTNGVTTYIVLTFTSAKSRRIKLELLANQFGGVIVPAGETVTRAADRPLYIAVADSFGGGAAVPPDGASRLETAPNYIAQALSMDLTNMSIAGTGWGITATPFEQRFLPSMQMGPAIIHVIGSRNNGFDDATTYTAATAALAAIVDAPYSVVSGPAQSSFVLVNTAVRNAAADNGIKFADVVTAVTAALTGTDGVHPTFAGHRVLAIAALNSMDIATARARIGAFSRVAPAVTLTANPAVSAAVGASVTLTAAVTSGFPGVVEFRSGGVLIGRSTVVSGSASAVTTTLVLGPHQFTARFFTADRLRVRNVTSDFVAFTVTAVVLSDIILTNLLSELDVAQLSALGNDAQIASMTPTRGSRTDALTQATAASRPTYITADTDGFPAIKQITTQSLPAPVWASPLAAGAQVTAFYVFKAVAAPTSNIVYISNYNASTNGIRLSMTTTNTLGLVASVGVNIPDVPNLVGRWVVYAVRLEVVGQATVFQNRLTGDLFNATHATMAYSGPSIGGGSGAAGAEIRHRGHYIYSGGMSNTDIQGMLVFLANRHKATLDSV